MLSEDICYYFKLLAILFFDFTLYVNVKVSGLQQRRTCERDICGSWILLILPFLQLAASVIFS